MTENIKKVAAVVLTYYPSYETIKNIATISLQVDHVFVVNNSYRGMEPTIFQAISELSLVTMLNLEENLGVAAGFNEGMKVAFGNHKYDYVVLFDQDSLPDIEMCRKLLEVAQQFGHEAGVIGPGLRDRTSKKVFKNSRGTGIVQKDVLISSGSLISRELVSLIGYHDERLFIDYVDHEYCLRAMRAGRRNYQVLNATMEHQFGDSECRSFFGLNLFISNYSELRQYYMARNRIYLFKLYGFGAWFWDDIFYASKAYFKVVFYERDRKKKIVAILKGIWDGLNG